VSDFVRVLLVLLKEYGPLCEPCVAHHARMTVPKASGMLKRLRRSVAVKVDHDECLGCRQFVQTFALVKTREDADVVTRADPGSLHRKDDPLCPVCLRQIEPKHAVTIDHGEVVHADCWGKPVRRDATIRRF